MPMMSRLTHLLALIYGLSLALHAAGARADGDTPASPPPQNCPAIQGRYTCRAPFLLSFKNRKTHELQVIPAIQDGYPVFQFKAADGANGFWAVGDGAPHAYDSDARRAWGYR